MVWLGCFLSSAKGYDWMGRQALSMGADTFQFFTRNPRGGKVKALDLEDLGKLRAVQADGRLGPVIAHAPYTINPAAADGTGTREFAIETMADDLRRLDHLPGNFYNLHPGSHVGQGMETGVENIARALNEVMFPGMETTVLLETMAGKGTEVGGRFEELRSIIDRVALPERIGVCLDTCHVHDGGYDVAGNLEATLEEFDKIVGLDRLRALHLNDSKNPLGARKDRHECLGQGHIGLEAMVRIVSHPALDGRPMTLETPCDLAGYEAEIRLLRERMGGRGRSACVIASGNDLPCHCEAL